MVAATDSDGALLPIARWKRTHSTVLAPRPPRSAGARRAGAPDSRKALIASLPGFSISSRSASSRKSARSGLYSRSVARSRDRKRSGSAWTAAPVLACSTALMPASPSLDRRRRSRQQLQIVANDRAHDYLEVLAQNALRDRVHNLGQRAEPGHEGHVEGDLAVVAHRCREPRALEALEVAVDRLEGDATLVRLDPLVLDPLEDAVLKLDRPRGALVSVVHVLAVDGDHRRRVVRVVLESREQLRELLGRLVAHPAANHPAPLHQPVLPPGSGWMAVSARPASRSARSSHSTCSSSRIAGGVRRMTSRALKLAETSTCRRWSSKESSAATLDEGISIPSISPSPRTSVTRCGKVSSTASWTRSSRRAPSRPARSTICSSSTTSSVAVTAAMASGAPANVEEWIDTSWFSGSKAASVATTALAGRTPPPSAFPASIMSGSTPSRPQPHQAPRRPRPVWISSTMRRAPAWVHARRTSVR